jgi:hypothetical protein
MGVTGKVSEKYKKIKDLKEETTFEALFDGHPSEFVKYMQYVRALPFEQKPDYDQCRRFFTSFLSKNGFSPEDIDYDWMLKREELIKQVTPELLEDTASPFGWTGEANKERSQSPEGRRSVSPSKRKSMAPGKLDCSSLLSTP